MHCIFGKLFTERRFHVARSIARARASVRGARVSGDTIQSISRFRAGLGIAVEESSGAESCASDHGSSRSGTSGMEIDGSNKPNVKMSVAEAMLTYCLPSTR